MGININGLTYALQRFHSSSPMIINSHCMGNLLKKGHSNIFAQFHAIKVMDIPIP